MQLFPLDSLAKDDPFALTLLGAITNVASYYFQEEDIREESQDDIRQEDREEAVFDEKKVKTYVEGRLPEMFETVSHLSWAASKDHERLGELGSNLIEAITTNSYANASKATMRLILKNSLFKKLLSQTTEHSLLPAQEVSESEGGVSDTEQSETQKSERRKQVGNAMEKLLERGFGFARSEDEKGAGKGMWKKRGLEGLNEKELKKEEGSKPGDMCTFAKTNRDYHD